MMRLWNRRRQDVSRLGQSQESRLFATCNINPSLKKCIVIMHAVQASWVLPSLKDLI